MHLEQFNKPYYLPIIYFILKINVLYRGNIYYEGWSNPFTVTPIKSKGKIDNSQMVSSKKTF